MARGRPALACCFAGNRSLPSRGRCVPRHGRWPRRCPPVPELFTMPLDRYLPCPGGTGKKIKFCCADLFGELEQIQRMLEGQQRMACLEHVQKTLARYPDRACLLAIKCLLEVELGQQDQLRKTLA